MEAYLSVCIQESGACLRQILFASTGRYQHNSVVKISSFFDIFTSESHAVLTPKAHLFYQKPVSRIGPALAAIFPLAYHNTPYHKEIDARHLRPTTNGGKNPTESPSWIPRPMSSKSQTRTLEKSSQMARWILARDGDGDDGDGTGGPQPGSEDDGRPPFTDGIDRSLSDALFEVMGRSRAEYMRKRKHYCTSPTNLFSSKSGSLNETKHQPIVSPKYIPSRS